MRRTSGSTQSQSTTPTEAPARSHTGLFLMFAGANVAETAPAAWSLDDVDDLVFGRGRVAAALRSTEGGRRRLAIRLADKRISSNHARIERDAYGKWWIIDAGSTNGTRINGGARIQEKVLLENRDQIEAGRTFFLFRDDLPSRPPDAEVSAALPPGLATLVPSLATSVQRLLRFARSGDDVLLLGESGTGKELVARALHDLSGREGKFVPVNCGAIPKELLEGWLFGCMKNSHSQAREDTPGLVRQSNRGTLLLDEIGELPPTSQVALLRVLEEREVLPVGGVQAIRVDLRVIAATNADLDAMMTEKGFRSDLYGRLAGHIHVLAPLRERREDLALITRTLVRRLAPARTEPVCFDAAAAGALCRHDWPQNVRELEKCLRAALTLAGRETIRLEHLPEALRGLPTTPSLPAPTPPKAPPRGSRPLRDQMKKTECRLIVEALDACQGDRERAAELLDLPLRTLYDKIQKCGIVWPRA